jgi:glycosyltransferase involved in cell wall biosynthesis
MSVPLVLAGFALVCAVAPCAMFLFNLAAYRTPARPAHPALPAVSILIPARNEANAIEAAVRAALSTTGIDFEVVVMDDSSTDGTPALVAALAEHDPRVRLAQAPLLPPGWNGKQHACWALAGIAANPLLCFVDADVRLTSECIARMAAQMERTRSSLISGFPRQITVTTLEWLLLPLIHFVLLGFLPISAMRRSTDPSFAAGCGQFMLVRAEDYFRCGGHTGIKLTMHDGLRLPRLFREHGLRTDLADLTSLATCRMYTSAAEVWNGLAKNATEGIADPVRIGPVTLILLLGQVFPFLILGSAFALSAVLFLYERVFGVGVFFGPGIISSVALLVTTLIAALAAWLPRVLACIRFRQDWRSALLHPLGIVVLLCLQWYALIRKVCGTPVTWRNRAYAGN